jgi:hypothetical protein
MIPGHLHRSVVFLTFKSRSNPGPTPNGVSLAGLPESFVRLSHAF